jgi:hypothetical protein
LFLAKVGIKTKLFGGEFSRFCEKLFWKKKYYVTNSMFKSEIAKKRKKNPQLPSI